MTVKSSKTNARSVLHLLTNVPLSHGVFCMFKPLPIVTHYLQYLTLFRCAVISSIPAGESKAFKCHGMEGRWVNVLIPGRSEYLTLCEVEVYAESSDDVQCMD